jgi:hypothetical protein
VNTATKITELPAWVSCLNLLGYYNNVLIQIVTELLSGSHSYKYFHILLFAVNARQKYWLMKFWNPCYRSENKKSSLLLRLCFYNFQQLNSYNQPLDVSCFIKPLQSCRGSYPTRWIQRFDASAHDYKTRNNVLIQIVTELLSGSHSYKYFHILLFAVNARQKYCLKRLSWELSNTMDTTSCIDALETALDVSAPKIFNTDQGAQFTSLSFTKIFYSFQYSNIFINSN